MQIRKTYCLLGLLLLTGGTALKSETQEERAARVEKIKASMRQNAAEPRGAVFQPSGTGPIEGRTALILREESVRNVAALLARWTQKEVFVSAQVEQLRVSVAPINGTLEEGIAALTDALAKIDVRIVEVGDSALALIKKDPAPEPAPAE